MKKQKLDIEGTRKILKFISRGYKVPDIIYDTIFKIAVREIEEKDKCVMIKRDPNVRRDRIAGQRVKITEGEAISIAPTSVGGFGADFDGDTMAVYVPLSDESQAEVKKKMISATTNMSINNQNFSMSNEMLTGLFTLTYLENTKLKPIKLNNPEEALKMEIDAPVIVTWNGENIKTTAGRVIFNLNTPSYIPFINQPVDKSLVNKKLFGYIIERNKIDYMKTVDNLTRIGFQYATMYPQTISIDMFEIPDNIKVLRDKLGKEKDPSRQMDIIHQMEKLLLSYLKDNVQDLYIQVASGSAKGISQLRQLMVAKGLINDPQGNLLPPITKSISDGMDPETYFNASSGSRMGMASRSLMTAFGGYAFRKFIYAVGNVTCDKDIADCGTRRGLKVKLTKDLLKKLAGRYVIGKNFKTEPISESMIGEVIELRSPMFCVSHDICRTCYGDLIHQIASRNCGIVAAQECVSLSESIMKCSVGLIQTDNGLICFDDLWEQTP